MEEEAKRAPGEINKKIKEVDFGDTSELFSLSNRFASLNKLITRDLNNYTNTPLFNLYNKSNINTYLSNPYIYEKQLRQAVVYIYAASPHFRRLIDYFTGLSDLAYIVSPYRIDPKKTNPRTLNINYRKVLNTLSAMSIKTQFPKILKVCFREDVFYGTFHITPDNITIQQLPADYCAISSIEGNVPNVTFNFSYFDSRQDLLNFYPEEFKDKYERVYKKDSRNPWIELDSPNSFAIKVNGDILEYACPPFAGLLREIYDIEDYKQMKKSKTAIENYAMVAMKLGIDKDGNWEMDLDKAKEFWMNLDSVLPEEIGSVLSPMDINKISFEKSNVGETNTVADAEQNLFSAAGVSSQLFNNDKASATALQLSIKADQAITFGVVKAIQDMVNRFIQAQSYGKNFIVTFLDCSPYNRKELGEQYLKACQFGLPMVSMYAATQGLGQAELDTMSFLEGEVLGLTKMFKPLKSSTQMSSEDLDKASGRPQKEDEDLTDSGDQSRRDSEDWAQSADL